MKRENKSEHAYKQIRKLILSRILEPGRRLVERSWARKLSVNQADVRQALSRLVGEGLLEHGEKGGTFVPQPDPAREKEFLRARLAVEVGAACLAVQSATREDLEELKQIVELMRTMADTNMSAGFCEADMRFHEVMVRAAHSPRLMDIYQRANFPLTLNPPSRGNILKRDTRKHENLLQALENRNFNLLAKRLIEGQTP
ncbi:MAG: GntR family transcriptional regulator [Phycisphaerae bacterium]|nr:GntR family transcriptional regulator [Phycisphaerae bacterium]